ncbi:MAG TPA: flagellar biosynthesis protein FlhA [Tepidisphaeraceae bacterium]|nr:flagellar biosynthesis protein FlhA [Tepidisphaeraceae bacterium]
MSHPMIRAAHAHRGMIFPLACVSLLLVLLVPLPPGVLDLLLILNLTLSIIVLVTTIYVRSPLEFAVFPSLLLSITLFRLVLNVATTRLILSNPGSESAAGDVVRAFSQFVTGDRVAIGAIIFLIIFVIQFVVITKGGSRISEVAARFMLDAMPGKQMAIDADLNQGAITQEQARARREAVAREADFYSGMDGAGKFVRGDALASVIIVVVNILGGLYVGLFEHGMQPLECARLYTKLTIGDGLVSQVPAFIVSLAAGLIVTRTGGSSNLGEDLLGQVFARPRVLIVAMVFLALLGLTEMPKLPLVILGACCGGLAFILSRGGADAEEPPADGAAATASDDEADPAAAATASADRQHDVGKMLDLDALGLELGHGLVRFAEASRGGDLLDRLMEVRRQIALELGLVVPPVRISDNPQLGVNDYAIKLRGQTIARGQTYPDQFLAIDEGEAAGAIIGGEETADPATGRLAYWITDSQGSEADKLFYRVVDAPSVLVAHLAEVIRSHAAELLTRQAVGDLLDNLRQRAAAVVDELIPDQVRPGELQKVLQNLLRERVPIRDLETILETVGDYAQRTRDADVLTEYVRVALGRTICKRHVDEHDHLPCLALSSSLEELIRGHIETGERGGVVYTVPPATAQRIGHDVADEVLRHTYDGRRPVVLVGAPIRLAVRRIIEPVAPHVAVLSVAEVTSDVAPDVVGVVGEEFGGSSSGGAGILSATGRATGDLTVEDGYESANV